LIIKNISKKEIKKMNHSMATNEKLASNKNDGDSQYILLHQKIKLLLSKIILASLSNEEQKSIFKSLNSEEKTKDFDLNSFSRIISNDIEIPPKPELGNFAYPCFRLSNALKKSPAIIAKDLSVTISNFLESANVTDDASSTNDADKNKFTHNKLLENDELKVLNEIYYISSVKPDGPYLNFFLTQEMLLKDILSSILKEKSFKRLKNEKPKTILIESPGPNTNKPLHLGHLRNMLLGDSLSKILSAFGEDPHIVNIINDRGIHICKSMIAYRKMGNGKTPKSEGIKSDHFVGDFYVLYSKLEKEDPNIAKEAEALLVKWENQDPDTLKLWEKMNTWAIEGFQKTYDKLGFNIEKDYFESQIYKKGREIILEGLNNGIFQKDETGAIIADLEDKSLGKKVLLRSNGTSVYITQDIYLAKKRYEEYKYDKMIYVVANEQERHFETLFEILKKLKFEFANNCMHFSYGMVELPEGKMKSREGNVIDTDDLIEQMVELSKEEIKKRYADLSEKEINFRAEKIALSAIKFFFLKFDPAKNFVFNPQESLSFEGETGPYIQYTYARIKSIEKKVNQKKQVIDFDSPKEIEKALRQVDYSLLNTALDFELSSLLLQFWEKIESASTNLKPSILSRYALDLSQCLNKYYHTNRVLDDTSKEDQSGAGMPNVSLSRLILLKASALVLKNALKLFGIDVLDEM